MEKKFVEQIHGILVHKLPKECRVEALEELSVAKLSFKRDSQDELGMRVFFNEYDCVWPTILRRRVMVRGKSYDIYPLVTNLTIHGIRRYADEMKIRKFVKPYGPVIDIYVVKKEHTQRRTSITEDYRVILDVSEVLANYHLNPVDLPDVKQKFPVSFFCRLCRQDGHKQYQCQAGTNGNFAKSALTERCVSYEGCQSTCPETARSRSQNAGVRSRPILRSEVDHSGGDFKQIHPRESSSGWITPASSRGYGNFPPKSHSSGMSQGQSAQKDSDTVSSRSPTLRSFTRSKNSLRDSHSFERRAPPNRYLGYKYFQESTRKSAPSTGYPRRTGRDASEDIRIAGKKNEIIRPSKQKHENAESSKRGEALLQPNSAKHLIRAKRDRLGCQSGRASSSSGFTEGAPSQPSLYNTASSTRLESRPFEDFVVDNAFITQGGDPSSSQPKKRRCRPLSISRDLSAIMERVRRKLESVLKFPEKELDLDTFLKQAWGRRNVVEIAMYFTSKISILIYMLKEVVRSYYISGKRGGEDDRVIDYIKRLCPRLERDIPADPHRH